MDKDMYPARRTGVPGCGGVFSRESGRFQSPGYPSPYESGLLCEWEIRAPPGERIQLTFESFHLEEVPTCEWDSLEVNTAGHRQISWCFYSLTFLPRCQCAQCNLYYAAVGP